MTASSLTAYAYGLSTYGRGPQAKTLAFQSLTTSQIIHALSCRSDTQSIFTKHEMQPNRYLSLAVFGSLGMQVLTQLVPGVRNLLGLGPIAAKDIAVIATTSVIPLLVSEFSKMVPEVEKA